MQRRRPQWHEDAEYASFLKKRFADGCTRDPLTGPQSGSAPTTLEDARCGGMTRAPRSGFAVSLGSAPQARSVSYPRR